MLAAQSKKRKVSDQPEVLHKEKKQKTKDLISEIQSHLDENTYNVLKKLKDVYRIKPLKETKKDPDRMCFSLELFKIAEKWNYFTSSFPTLIQKMKPELWLAFSPGVSLWSISTLKTRFLDIAKTWIEKSTEKQNKHYLDPMMLSYILVHHYSEHEWLSIWNLTATDYSKSSRYTNKKVEELLRKCLGTLLHFEKHILEFHEKFVRLERVDIFSDLEKLDRERLNMNLLEFVSCSFLQKQFIIHPHCYTLTMAERKKQTMICNFSKKGRSIPKDWIVKVTKGGLSIFHENCKEVNNFIMVQHSKQNTVFFEVDFSFSERYLLNFFNSPVLPKDILIRFIELFRDFKKWLTKKGLLADSNLAEMILEFSFPFTRSTTKKGLKSNVMFLK